MFYEGCIIEEVIAYSELVNETFDFGEGPMKMTRGEWAYQKMDIQLHEDMLEAIEWDKQEKASRDINHSFSVKKEGRKKYAKRKNQLRLKNLDKRSGGQALISESDGYLVRYYRPTGFKNDLKRSRNKRVRTNGFQITKGSLYKKIGNYNNKYY